MHNIVYISGWAETENSFDYLWKEKIKLKKFAPCSYFENQSPKFPSYYARKISEQIKEQSIIVAWSLGGMIAQEIAAINPHLISKLLLINSTNCLMEVAILRSMKLGLKKDYEKTFKNFVNLAYNAKNEYFITTKLKEINKFPLENLLYGLDYFLNIDLRKLEYKINFPVYLLHSREDRVVPPESSNFLFPGYENKKIMEIDSDNHAMYANNQLNEIINNILYDQ